jgi:hypothetical protein
VHVIPAAEQILVGLLDPFWVGRRPHLFDQACHRG